jgi:hypothetical protein
MSHGSDKKSREQLLAEIEALRQQLAASEAQGDKHSPGDSSSPSLSRPITRREALTAWVAPVILSVPIVAALHSETARGQVPPTAPPTPSPPSPSPPTGAPTLAPTLAPTPSPPTPSPPTGAPTLAPTLAPTMASVAVPGIGLAGIAVLGGALAAAGAKLLKDRDATSEKPDPEGDGGTE